MSTSDKREYKIDISPRVLELLGPSLYTNIYYVLAELIANAYDADASNVYIIEGEDYIIVEDDGTGMSYSGKDIERYLGVAIETRTDDKNSYTVGKKRKRIGRKGIGKLAALSVSENVWVMTAKNNERSGFILSRHVGDDHLLQPLNEDQINFQRISEKGTSIKMTNPQYGLHKTATAIKNNLLKIFPLINSDFKVHIITQNTEIIIDSFDKEMIEGLGALIILGNEYHYLSDYFNHGLNDENLLKEELLKMQEAVILPLKLINKKGEERDYELKIKGWIGAYRSTSGRKKDTNDFPDNFISILSNSKLGEYNILPLVGQNKLYEVYVVGQLHIDLFEETELPDMALSNRQGYKTDDKRYEAAIAFIREQLLPEIVNMRVVWGTQQKKEKDRDKHEQQEKDEEELKKKVHEYKVTASQKATEKIESELGGIVPKGIKEIIQHEMNEFLPIVGLKSTVDAQKKRIMISQTKANKNLSDVIYKMLSFNGAPDEDIIYTNSDNEDCRIPNRMDLFEYLRKFFVNSISDKKMFVIYVTSNDMAKSWGAVSEVGAGWITQSNHEIFNIHDHKPANPLNVRAEWHTSNINGNNITMNSVEFDKFIVKILDICRNLGYRIRTKEDNEKELKRYVEIK